MDGLASMVMNETPAAEDTAARDALRRYFGGFGITETEESDRLIAAVLNETGAGADAETALVRAEALVGAWFAQALGLSADFAALAPTMAMAAFQRGRFAPGTLLSVAPLPELTLRALSRAVPVVRPASSGLPMLPQNLKLPSLAAMARRLLPGGGEVEADRVSTAH